MAFLKGLLSGLVAEVEASRALRTTLYPRDLSAGGAYWARWSTGVVGAALAVDAALAAVYNGPTANTKNVYILELVLAFHWVAAATAAQQFGIYLERFTGASPASGTAHVPMKLSPAYGNSACMSGGPEGGDLRAAATSALTVNGVVWSGQKVPVLGWTTPAAGAGAERVINRSDSQSPALRLAPGEGLGARNLVGWPAAGTGVLSGYLVWEERAG